MVAKLRPKPSAEAYLRLRTLPAEQAQVDWADFGKHDVNGSVRRLYAFVMVLSYSRSLFLKFSYSAAMGAFVRGHVQAFKHFGGVARTVLYDNLKSAVTRRVGDAIEFNSTLLEFATHYRFLPKPVAVARGNEKGRVERAIQFVRTSFFQARTFRDIDDLNAQAQQWVGQVANQRRCPDQPSRKVCEVFEDERSLLLALPDNPFPDEDCALVSVGKTPYVRFDLNDYSVPHQYVRRTLTVLGTEHRVRIVDGFELVATHDRCWGKGHQIEIPEHIEALCAEKHMARHSRSLDRIHHACPSCASLFRIAAQQGGNLNALTVGLGRLLDCFSPEMLESAIVQAIETKNPTLHAIRHLLDLQQQQRNQPPPVPLHLSARARAMSRPVRPHALTSYDGVGYEDENDAIF